MTKRVKVMRGVLICRDYTEPGSRTHRTVGYVAFDKDKERPVSPLYPTRTGAKAAAESIGEEGGES